MYSLKGFYVGRLGYSGFVVATRSTSIVLDPTTLYFNGKKTRQESLVERIVSSLEIVPRPLFVLLTSKDYVDVKLLEKLQLHYAAKIYAPRKIREFILEKSLFLTTVRELKEKNTFEIGNFKVTTIEGDEANFMYLIEGWGRSLFFTGDGFSKIPIKRIYAITLSLNFYSREKSKVENILASIVFGKLILTHLNTRRRSPLIEELKKSYSGRVVVIEDFSKLIKI